MAKIRHIAIRAEDPESTAQLFVEAFGLEIVRRRGVGAVDLSDGDVNITLLPLKIAPAGVEIQPGVEHIGFTVEDEAETRDRLLALGAVELPPVPLGDVHYEVKFKSREGLILDLGHWAGTSPIPEAEKTNQGSH